MNAQCCGKGCNRGHRRRIVVSNNQLDLFRSTDTEINERDIIPVLLKIEEKNSAYASAFHIEKALCVTEKSTYMRDMKLL